jgi:hypothetical protein
MKKTLSLAESIRRASTELRRKQLLRNEGSDPDKLPAPVVERRLCPEAPSLTGTLQPAVPGDGTSFTHSRRRPVARGGGIETPRRNRSSFRLPRNAQ